MKLARLVALIIALVIAGACAATYWGWEKLTDRVEVDSTKLVTVERGATPTQTLDALMTAGILRDKLPLQLFIKLTGAGPRIKAGDYYFQSPISPMGVLQQLEEGGQGADKITIIEGWDRWDIAAAMARISSLKLKNSDAALKLMNNVSLIKDLDPGAANLEGYLFPDTYFVYSSSTGEELIEGMVDQFHAIWTTKLAASARAAGKSVHEVVTVASIVETEAKLPEDRPIVASVIYNRIKQNMTLSVDDTLIYAAKLAGKWKDDGKVYQSDINRVSPYNTRNNHGLPPGPVSSPGLASLEAAINPANTAYLYYVRNPARNDGAHNFYVTANDFEQGVKALRDWEQKHKTKRR